MAYGTIAIKDSEAIFRRAWEKRRPRPVETTLAGIKSLGGEVGQALGIGAKGFSFQVNKLAQNELNYKLVELSWRGKATSRVQTVFRGSAQQRTPGMKINQFFFSLRMVVDI